MSAPIQPPFATPPVPTVTAEQRARAIDALHRLECTDPECKATFDAERRVDAALAALGIGVTS
ncbi:hypothetical protein [Cellulomonas sp. C5510]|uniref:hypothetical protein n=1 Tax=Cellulomonas sp. C5510 TaxID=2871170 RepID=UPI001C94C274|nr:hypothetical protein [Cellulomonas sp. C5510]QZN86936.1 hypothetical protein K5O09_07445 [Cellulomonas sp. C5510]